jgi:UDP-N-acetylglucosamine diphosphorylase / glucose-1-phosphate thymidylyltransferase / UDP-N-acetylgalactosamine diphosphorylase / glucosamine-1-phosphate N-acetyltransferase / galactosamine-1-phosphate N-acetyltransferase
MKDELVVVILAGGEGKRFWPIKSDKVNFPFLDKPFLYHSVIKTIPPQVKRIIIIANAKNIDLFENIDFPIPHKILIQKEPRGMADALLCAKNELKGVSLLIYIADHLIDKELIQSVIKKAEDAHVFAVLPGWIPTSYFPGGYLLTDGDTVTGIKEKPGAGKEPSKYVYISGNYISDSNILLDELTKTTSETDDVYEKAITKLAETQLIKMVPYAGVSASLKYPWHILDVMDNLLSDIKKHQGMNVIIKQNVIIEGNVFLGDNVKIFENSKIIGPSYIGDNTIIGNNNIIRGSYIGSDCVTGFNTDITRSYVGNSCWFHSNYIGDSILEENVSMGSGATLANLRLDEKEIFSTIKGERISTQRTKLGACIGRNVRIGVNVSTMPGIKIGSGSFISSGSILNEDIPENSYVEVEKHIKVKPNREINFVFDRDKFRKKLK